MTQKPKPKESLLSRIKAVLAAPPSSPAPKGEAKKKACCSHDHGHAH